MTLSRSITGAALLSLGLALGCSDDSVSISSQRYSALSDSSFAVGDSSILEIGNFAGKVTVMPGDLGLAHVVATKWAGQQQDLDEIGVEMVQIPNGVRIRTTSPSGLTNTSVDLEVTVPADARPTIHNGAGDIGYEGGALGESSFSVGAGSIALRLPAEVNVELYLSVGVGSIRVEFPIVGQVTEHLVDGVIGTGANGRIVAQVAAGGIEVISQ
jgi:hypothetical protein